MPDPAEIEMMRQILAQDAMAPQRMPRPGDPGLPPGGMTVARSALNPSADALMRALNLSPGAGPALSMTTGVGEEFGQQPDRMGRALAEAEYDPTIPKVTNAALQTALAAGRPVAAAGSVGAGYGAAALKDLGLFDPSTAEAASAKKGAAPSVKLPGITPEMQQTFDHAVKRLNEQDYSSGAERRMLEDTVKEIRGVSSDSVRGSNAANAAAEGAAAKGKVDEYNRAVETADAAFNREMKRDRRFSDTTVGQVWDQTGGLGNAAVGFLGGKGSRLATGPGKTLAGQVMKDYVLPLTSGAVGGAIASNLPLAYNALYTEPDNPKKRAFEAKAEALPPDHPRRQEFFDYARDLPNTNPVRDAARKEFYDDLGERSGIGGLEGFGGALFGTDLIRALARGAKGLRGPGGSGGGTGGPAGPSMPPAEGGQLIPLPKGPMPAGPGLPPGGPAAGPSATGTLNKDLMEALKQAPPANANKPKKATKDALGAYHDDLGRYTPKPD